MRRKNLTNAILMICSIAIMIVSGVMFVYSAQQQSASTSLSVTFSGHHVNCSVEGWYQVKGDTQRTALKNSTNGTKVTFSATEGSTEKTLEINNVASENKAILTSQKEYVLFTYKFTNTATDGAYGIEVSLTLDSISNSNLKAVKYGTSSSLYTNSSAGLGEQYTTLSSSSDTVFTDVFIVAGGDDTLATGTGIKYFYILLEVNDLTLPVSFNPDFTWTIESSNEVEEAEPLPTITYSTNTSITLTEDMASNIVVTNNAEVTIDAGYYNITGNVAVNSGTVTILHAAITGDVAITGGTATISDTAITGNVTITSGTATIQSTAITRDVTITGGTATIRDGANITGNVTITGGTATIDNGWIQGNLSISGTGGAEIRGDNSTVTGNLSTTPSNLTIYNGVFTFDPSPYALIPEGYEVSTFNPGNMTLYRVAKQPIQGEGVWDI